MDEAKTKQNKLSLILFLIAVRNHLLYTSRYGINNKAAKITTNARAV